MRHAPSWLVPAAAASALVEAGLLIAQAGLIAWLANAVLIEKAGIASLSTPLLELLTALIARAGLVGIRSLTGARASAAARLRLRHKLMVSLLRAGPARVPASGQVLSAFERQVEALDGYYASYLPRTLETLIIPVLVLATVFSLNWIAGLALLLTAPLIPFFMALIGMGAESLSRSQYQSMAQLSGWFLDRASNAATLKLFGAEAAELERVREMTDSLRQKTMRVLRLAFLSSAVLEFLTAIAIASVAIYVGMSLLGYLKFGPSSGLDFFSGLFVLLLAPEFFQPLRQFSASWHDRADARAAVAEIQPLLNLEPARAGGHKQVAAPVHGGCSIRIQEIRFAHPGRQPLFEQFKLEIGAGEKVVLVGPSGVGKSTLMQMLAGFIEPQSGRILFDGVDMTTLSDESLSSHVAWLGQRPVLFHGTIAGNIHRGWPEANADQVRDMAVLARVTEFADRLPEGLEAPVGEGGYGLSGGQVQRIALARALLRPRPIVLLDEPTASLDPAGEARVIAALEAVLSRRSATVVCATHRSATMQWAERIIEMPVCRRIELAS
ncbi:MAG: thiol reductant ABC exporter subunit CydD [Wenzhouxiangellaceae bacterium]|nr:thiol reductant ABC exporter subunit CydD [Wenzhouxiangellaceae bacterium]